MGPSGGVGQTHKYGNKKRNLEERSVGGKRIEGHHASLPVMSMSESMRMGSVCLSPSRSDDNCEATINQSKRAEWQASRSGEAQTEMQRNRGSFTGRAFACRSSAAPAPLP